MCFSYLLKRSAYAFLVDKIIPAVVAFLFVKTTAVGMIMALKSTIPSTVKGIILLFAVATTAKFLKNEYIMLIVTEDRTHTLLSIERLAVYF